MSESLVVEGWLLKCNGGLNPSFARSKASCGCGHGRNALKILLWRRRFFRLTCDKLRYWHVERDGTAPARGEFVLAQVDGVTVVGQDFVLNFAVAQSGGSARRGTKPRFALRLRATCNDDAERWAAALRAAAASQIAAGLPADWDVAAMLCGSVSARTEARRVAKLALTGAPVTAVQGLLDHTFVCKRTRDRRGLQEMPLRLEVVEVTAVQNVAAWIEYSATRQRISFLAKNANAACNLLPPVRTSTSCDASLLSSIGDLDPQANEQWLFHGSTSAAVEGITDRNWRMDLAGTHAGDLYGKAVYLAECSSKADEYSEDDGDGLHSMLLCRTLLGRVLCDCAKSPDATGLASTCSSGGAYDSVCGDRWRAVGTFREFVLYDHQQVYPSYIVKYRRKTQAELISDMKTAFDSNDDVTSKILMQHFACLIVTHHDNNIRARIIMALRAHLEAVVPALLASLMSVSASQPQRCAVVTMIGRLCAEAPHEDTLGTCAKNVVSALDDLLEDPSPKIRCAAAKALGEIGVEAGQAASSLTAICIGPGRHELSNVSSAIELEQSEAARLEAISALGQMGAFLHPDTVLPVLTRCLRGGAEAASPMRVANAATAAASAMGRLGRQAISSVSDLSDVLVQSSSVVDSGEIAEAQFATRVAAAAALASIGADLVAMPIETSEQKQADSASLESIVTAITYALQAADERVRMAAAEGLGVWGKKEHANPWFPDAIHALRICASEDVCDTVRGVAVHSLATLGELVAVEERPACTKVVASPESTQAAAMAVRTSKETKKIKGPVWGLRGLRKKSSLRISNQ